MTSFVGLDLGQAQDYTALSVVDIDPTIRKHKSGSGGSWADQQIVSSAGLPLTFNVRHLQRYALGTSYPAIVEDVSQKVRQLSGAVLTIDHTGSGRPVFDLFERAGLHPLGITITSGQDAQGQGRLWKVPKRDLVGILQVAVQSERLKVAKGLPEASVLVNELLNFRVKINLKTAHDSYEAWRQGVHDDPVLSVALACWTAEQYYTSQERRAYEEEAQKKLDQELERIFRDLEL